MKKYRKVNRMFDTSPVLFGLISTDALMPFAGMIFMAMLPLQMGQTWIVSLVVLVVELSSYSILTAGGSHKFFSRFKAPPHWIKLPLPYNSFLQKLHDIDNKENTKASRSKRTK